MKTKSKAVAPRTAAAVQAEIAALDDAARPRVAMLAGLEAERPGMVDAGDIDGIEALDARIRRARIEGEVDATRRGKLVADYESLDAAEHHAADQALRREDYDAARKAADEAAHLYREEYPRLARELAELLTRVAEIGRQVEVANARLPEDAGLISLEFEPSRGRLAIPSRTRKFKRHVWVNKMTGQEVYQRIGDPSNYEQREREDEIASPAVMPIPHVPLRHLVSLPGVAFGDPAFWTPHGGYLAPPGGSSDSFYQVAGLSANPPLGGGAPRLMGIGGRN